MQMTVFPGNRAEILGPGRKEPTAWPCAVIYSREQKQPLLRPERRGRCNQRPKSAASAAPGPATRKLPTDTNTSASSSAKSHRWLFPPDVVLRLLQPCHKATGGSTQRAHYCLPPHCVKMRIFRSWFQSTQGLETLLRQNTRWLADTAVTMENWWPMKCSQMIPLKTENWITGLSIWGWIFALNQPCSFFIVGGEGIWVIISDISLKIMYKRKNRYEQNYWHSRGRWGS